MDSAGGNVGHSVLRRDHDVRGGQGGRDITVDDRGTLVPVRVGMQQRAFDARCRIEKRGFVPQRVPLGRLQDGDVSSEIREQASGPCTGQPGGQVDYAKSGEGVRHWLDRLASGQAAHCPTPAAKSEVASLPQLPRTPPVQGGFVARGNASGKNDLTRKPDIRGAEE